MMTRGNAGLIHGILVLAGLFVVGAFAAAADEPSCNGIDVTFLARHLPFKVSSIAAKREAVGGLCEIIVHVDGETLPMYASVDKDLVIAGDLFRNGKHVTMEGMQALRKKEISRLIPDLDRSVAFTYKPSEADRHVYFFTDPDCTYCESAKAAAKTWAHDAKVELRVVMYPLDMHPDARGKAVRAICSGMTYEQYAQNVYGSTECDAGRDKVALSSRTAEALGVAGTPTFMNSSGDLVMGFNTADLDVLMR